MAGSVADMAEEDDILMMKVLVPARGLPLLVSACASTSAPADPASACDQLLGPCPVTACDMVDSVPAPGVEQEVSCHADGNKSRMSVQAVRFNPTLAGRNLVVGACAHRGRGPGSARAAAHELLADGRRWQHHAAGLERDGSRGTTICFNSFCDCPI